MKKIFALMGILAFVGLVVACSSQPATAPTQAPKPAQVQPAQPAQPSGGNPPAASSASQKFEITLTPTEMRPSEITVKAGSTVHFVLTNVDKTEEHNLVAAKAKFKEILVPPNSTVEADWVVPATSGDFEVPCSIHREIIPLTIHVVP